MNFNFSRPLLFIAMIMGLTGCGLQDGMESASSNGDSVAQFEAMYGALPALKSGSQVMSIRMLKGAHGQVVLGKTGSASYLYDGKRSHYLRSGEEVILLASLKSEDGKDYYLAQVSEGPKLIDGYLKAREVEGLPHNERQTEFPGDDPDSPNTPGMPGLPGLPGFPGTPSHPDCPVAISVTSDRDNALNFMSKQGYNFTMVMGDEFRQEDDDAQFYLNLGGHLNASAIEILVTNLDHNISFPLATVSLDESRQAQQINFKDFIPKNSWRSTEVSFHITFVGEPDVNAPTECGIGIRVSSPIVFDFSKDQNLKTVSVLDSKTTFDLDADGLAERTGWIAPETAFLGLDLNGNGNLDSGKELFGNFTSLFTGMNADNGYEALREYLVFNDPTTTVITKTNPVFDNLILWEDHNKDGISQFNELKHPADAGVTGIATEYVQNVDATEAFRNEARYQSKFFGDNCPASGCNTYDIYFSTVAPMQMQVKNHSR